MPMSTSTKEGKVHCSIRDNIATLEFEHPAGNSCTLAMLQQMTSEIKNLENQESLRIIVLQSSGSKTFCAGANLKEVCSLQTIEEATAFFSGFANLINALKNSSKLIVGRVQGKAVGGGLGLIAACDLVFAYREASLRLSELNLGIAPLVIAPVLIRKMGVSAFSSLSTDPTQWRKSTWGLQHGLFHKSFDSLIALDEALESYKKSMENSNAKAIAYLKDSIWEGTDHWEEALVEKAAKTAELALSKFTQKQLEKYRT